ncbi:MAG: hypothetical protein KF764_00570 [Labilithrix sp.]|nr:hypothetical protein [Labilithrix sp.]
MRRTGYVFALVASFALLGWASGCGDAGESVFTGTGDDEDGGTPQGPGPFGENDGGPADDGSVSLDCDAGCPNGFVCVGSKCLPPQGKCSLDGGAAGSCQFDTYCDPATETCLPFAPGGNNTACTQVAIPGNFAPKTKCEFPTAIPIVGDAFPNHVDVQTTPVVVRFGPAATPPSIVAPFSEPVPFTGTLDNYTEHLGVLRILKGTDCTQEAVLGGVDLDDDGNVDWFRSSASVAVADLDADGLPDIVAFMSSGPGINETLMAFTRKSGTWQPLWATKKATLADGVTIFRATVPNVGASGKGNWASPSIHDLDDDGVPEIVREGWVFDGLTGRLRATPPANYATYRQGIHPVLANLDDDARIEMTNGARVWEFNGTTNAWVEETYYSQTQSSPSGWTAVADFDRVAGVTQVPEIAVSAGNSLTVFKTDHSVFMGMAVSVPGGGGGPPTIADFDGDGLPEIGVAGQAYYTVFDPDCQGTPRPGGACVDRTHCDHVAGGACPDRILWSRATQDISSNVTGSSVFDFEADGKAEVVYADECFTRVYSGTDGSVLFSRYRSSCTWNENPIVADVDGDFRAELVVPSNTACGEVGVGRPCTAQTDPTTTIDTQFAGLRCLANADCVSNVCDAGFCRCMTSADCCGDKDVAQCEAFGTRCAAPPAGTPGTGNTCRANRPKATQGIRVYEDAADRWVRSRTIWNQHAYAVTNINEDGTVPKTSVWAKNWTQPNLNNFRQNVPGTQNALDIGDLTAQASASFTCTDGVARLATPICNRGTAPIGAGVSVGFYVGATKVCGAKTAGVLQVGQCESVACNWATPPRSSPGTDVTVVPNDDNALQQCDPNNDKGLVKGVFCKAVN